MDAQIKLIFHRAGKEFQEWLSFVAYRPDICRVLECFYPDGVPCCKEAPKLAEDVDVLEGLDGGLEGGFLLYTSNSMMTLKREANRKIQICRNIERFLKLLKSNALQVIYILFTKGNFEMVLDLVVW